MSDRAFDSIKIGTAIYCSSSYDHFIQVQVQRRGKWQQRPYWIEGATLEGMNRVPNYLYVQIERQLLKLLEDGNATFYEFDRDGNKRFTDLRYHDAEWSVRRIERLRREYVTD